MAGLQASLPPGQPPMTQANQMNPNASPQHSAQQQQQQPPMQQQYMGQPPLDQQAPPGAMQPGYGVAGGQAPAPGVPPQNPGGQPQQDQPQLINFD